MPDYTVHIIASLRDKDLDEGVPIQQLLRGLGLRERLYYIASEDQLLQVLQQVVLEDLRGPSSQDPDVPMPVVHLATHGGPDCADFRFGPVWWAELARVLDHVSDHTCELGVVASMCFGAYGRQMLAYANDPFDFLVGPTVTLNAGELLQAWTRFYRTLARNGDPVEGIQAIRDPRFVLYDVEPFPRVVREHRLRPRHLQPLRRHGGAPTRASGGRSLWPPASWALEVAGTCR